MDQQLTQLNMANDHSNRLCVCVGNIKPYVALRDLALDRTMFERLS